MAKKVTFEEKMEKLDTIVRELEQGDLELEKSLKLFGDGIKLSKECSKELKDAKFKVTMLLEDKETGEMQEEDFQIGLEEV